jgi:glycosyltransferase involved in cell wall biosynthesis
MVSAIITTHNREDLLPRAINSVMTQTYKELELIVVSDGSKDGTDKLMGQYSNDKRINYISYYPGKGGNYARNIGIEAAKGEFIAFLDDDDEWLPTKIEKQMELMNADHEVGLVYTGINCIYVNEGIKYTFKPTSRGDLSKEILFQNCIGSTSSVMLRKSLCKDCMFDENLQALQDFDLWIKVLQGCKADVVVEPMVNYYNYRNQIQVSSSTAKYVQATDYINKKYSDLFARLSPQEYKQKQINDIMLLGNKAMRNNSPSEARKFFLEAFEIRPSVSPIVSWLLSFFGYNNMLRLKSKLR